MARTNRYHFLVTLNRKPGDRITKEQTREYVKNAVQSWHGCYPPDSEEFFLDGDQFSVRNFIPPSKLVKK